MSEKSWPSPATLMESPLLWTLLPQLMPNNLPNWVSQYTRHIQKQPNNWLLVLILIFLPSPLTTISPIPTPPPALAKFNTNLPSFAPYPVNTTGIFAPDLTAHGIYIVDTTSMVPLYQKNPDLKLRPASTTKIMTALVAMDKFSLTDTITANKASQAIGKVINLKTDESLTFEDALYGLLLESGNDVALDLAENYPGGYTEMIKAMNQKAHELGMNNTYFTDVSGIDNYRHETTVHDMSILSATAIKNTLFAQIISTREKEIKAQNDDTIHQLKNTNELLGAVGGVFGVKTGWTALAGDCLITAIERDGHTVIITLFGSADRFGETKKLIDWVFANHEWKQVDF